MTATAARIGFVQNQFRRVVASSGTIISRYGNLARQSEDPIETFFDDEDDAQLVADERQALLGADRRRFKVRTVGVDEFRDLIYAGRVPVATYVDDARSANRPVLISDFVIDLDKQAVTATVWG